MDQPNADARRSLGVRPGARPRPKIQITNDSPLPEADRDSKQSSPRSPRSPRSPILSLIVPSGPKRDVSPGSSSTPSGSGEGFRRLRRPTISRKNQTAGVTSNRGQYETQKLLSHLLDRLEARPRPPDLLDRAALAACKANGVARAKTKHRAFALGEAVAAAAIGHKLTSSADNLPREDEEEDLYLLDEGEWNIDATYDMVEQMRNLLVLAEKQHFDVFGACQVSAAEAARAAAAKDRRRGSRFASSPLAKTAEDPFAFDPAVTVSGPDLLRRMAEAVRTLLTVDCLYKTTKFRLMQPPYALPAVCMDIAAVLYHKGDLKVQLEMVEAVVDGLYSMGDVLREKVFEWLEGRLAEMLHKLARERGADDQERRNMEWNDPFADSPSPTVPTFAFSVHPADDTDPHDTGTVEHKPGWVRFSPTSASPLPSAARDKLHGILSTHTASGNISLAAMRIAAIVPHILVAITSTVDLRSLNLVSIYRVHRLLSLILSAKPDAALDLIEIIAHGPSQTRSRGLDFLATFYPESVGHNVIARRPALATHQAHMAKWESGQERVLGEDDAEGHAYIPWRAREDEGIKCTGCYQLCIGFCVRCTLCQGIKHASCLQLYQEETYQYNVLVQGPGETQPSRTEVVHVQFSKCIPRLDEKVLGGGATKGTTDSTTRRVGQHDLHLVNLFRITLCAECHEPLWGATAQGYACMGVCQRFFHVSCAEEMAKGHARVCRPGFEIYANPNNPPTARDPFSASAVDVRESFQRAADRLYRDPDRLGGASYDEISLLYASTWTQLEILNNGIASGSLRVHHEGNSAEQITSLAAVLSKYKAILDKGNLPMSSAVEEYGRISGETSLNCDLLWRLGYLRFCAALLRAPTDSLHAPSLLNPTGLLTVADSHSSQVDPPSVAYEAVQMHSIRQTLKADLNVHSDLAASILIDQLRLLGLCSIANTQRITPPIIHSNSLTINFPLPQLMDASPSVELLVLVIEQLLDDIDITANEQGLSLLVNRAWPSSMCALYAMERLGGAVMSWIMAEDDVLHHVVKNYASKRRRPPGVRTSTKGEASVNGYRDDRDEIRARYARPWLKALHDLDPGLYGELAYDRSKIIDDRWGVIDLKKGDAAASQVAGMALDRITALADANATFDITLDLLTAWLEDIRGLAHEDAAFKALPRLLRHSHDLNGSSTDLWTLANETSRDDVQGLQRVCRWLRVLACSGVEVPWESLTALMDLDSLAQIGEESRSDLVLAAGVNSAPIAHDAHAELLSRLFANVVESLHKQQRDDIGDEIQAPSDIELDMLRTGMVAILRAYEVKVSDIETSALHNESTAKQLMINSKKKNIPLRTRPIPLDADAVLAAARLLGHRQYPAEPMLDFIWLLIKAPAADNPVGFLHHICSELYEFLWPLYDRPVHRASRARLLTKLLTINSKPLETLAGERAGGRDFDDITRERLYTFVLELADERVTQDVDVPNWRRSAVGLVLKLFSTAIPSTDSSPQNLVMWRGLMPAHLEALTLSFENYLLFGSTDEQRLALLSKLLHLQTLKPSWPFLGWKAIENIVTEQVQTIEALHEADTVHALTAVADALTIRAAALSLGLNMLAAGVPCEWTVLQRFQQFAAAACDLPWPSPCDAITLILLPALKNILDSSRRISATQDADEKKTVLVGSLFVPVVIKFATVLHDWDFVVQRHILDILLVVFFKHNVRSVQLHTEDALRATSYYASTATNAQNGILAIQVLRTAQERMDRNKFSHVVPQLFINVAWTVIRPGGDTELVDSGLSFMQEAMSEFGSAGLLLHVLRMQSDQGRDRPTYLGEAIQMAGRESEDTMQEWLNQLFRYLPDVLREPRKIITQTALPLANLIKSLKCKLSEESILEFGAFISRLGKLAGEWDSPRDFDPNPVIQTCAHVLKLAPGSSAATLLHQIATFVQVAVTRYTVWLSTLFELVPVTVEVVKQHHPENTVAAVIFDTALAGVRGQTLSAPTLTSLLQFLAHDENDSSTLTQEREKVMVEASYGCGLLLLREHPSFAVMRDPELTMKLLDAAATVIVRAEVLAPGNTGFVLSSAPKSSGITQVHVFGHILYASLAVNLGSARADLISLYPVLARATARTMYGWSDLLSVLDPTGEGSQFGENVFIVMRLATLAINDPNPTSESPATSEALAAFWRRLWPEWDRLLGSSLAPSCANDMLRAFTIPLLLDIVLFVASAAPLLLVDAAAIVGRGLNAIEDWDASQDIKSSKHKLARAVAALESVLRSSDETPLNRAAAVEDVRKAMVNGEKMRTAVLGREPRERERERAPTRMGFR
ncbi:hypothetical protein CC85DRAFT_283464 [Cutaneotrichosporon oleaginosum]|uniref:Phorbol-ester/DAG-type domain-containing protein n=1 Tax=Cutaneotrichosporon oleaginosum TaxID=879819 RepID=A0A0J0XTX0_9TREE|nr:uncharacterized protein CC85DRAFT_283464 [Cutaneotrichosporon oleaginosum]KLT44526.1 hypothetical protein CC85DRAFT_283464 [Cutaneotrichosporon oleaginosum]TXT13958.1 hypothetical protein COLE_00151 [Cutaneotrichosporon oleaginosum]